MIICGIDPGQTGALAITDKPAGKHTMPLPYLDGKVHTMRLHAYLDDDPPIDHIFIEKPIYFPGQSCVATATTAENYGRLIATIELAHIPYTEVRPCDWTKEMFRGMPKCKTKKERKEQSIRRAMQLWPGKEKWTDGEAEAALIAAYGARTLEGKIA